MNWLAAASSGLRKSAVPAGWPEGLICGNDGRGDLRALADAAVLI
jgi:hypothetical protein